MKARRIIVRLDPRPVGLQALARLAEELDAELLGLFVENVELLRLAALPFAREVGHASGVRRELDVAAMERAWRARARELRRACAEALRGSTVSWSFRVARGSPGEELLAAIGEAAVPTLVVPPGADPRAAPTLVPLAALTEQSLRELLETERRPILIRP